MVQESRENLTAVLTEADKQIIASLQKPGAGLPLPARILNRLVIKPFVMGKADWDWSTMFFQKTNDKFLQEISEIDEYNLTRRILVPSQRGLEDSSRYWSAAMVARHLTIVSQHMTKAVIDLSRGQKMDLRVNVADVKPEGELNRVSSVDEYRKSSLEILERIGREVADKNSQTTHYHPWFGQLRARDWMWLLGMHTRIHLVQLREIKKRL